jgi:hypothetical protein
MSTDTSEQGLETLTMRQMTCTNGLAPLAEGMFAGMPNALSAAKAAGSDWLAGHPKDYDSTHTLDVPQLFHFLHTNQPETFKKLGITDFRDAKDINRQKFFSRFYGNRLETIHLALPPRSKPSAALQGLTPNRLFGVITEIVPLDSETSFLRECGTRLVSDVMTGKPDLRSTSKPLPIEPVSPDLRPTRRN